MKIDHQTYILRTSAISSMIKKRVSTERKRFMQQVNINPNAKMYCINP